MEVTCKSNISVRYGSISLEFENGVEERVGICENVKKEEVRQYKYIWQIFSGFPRSMKNKTIKVKLAGSPYDMYICDVK